MQRFFLFTFIALLMFMFGCSTPQPSSFTIFNAPPHSTIGKDEGQVVVFYPEDASVQSACYINVDGKRRGVIKQGTFTTLVLVSGEHVISIENDSHTQPRVMVRVSYGETEYLEVGQIPDVLIAKTTLRLSDKKVAESQIPLLKYIQWNR